MARKRATIKPYTNQTVNTMQTLKTKIDGYTVELEIDPKAEPPTQCYVSKGKYNASLACLADTGELESPDGYAHSVHGQTIAAIEQWAEENGY
jgi:hypothetical protein